MKIVVDEMPIHPSECIFGDYRAYYDVAECKLSPNCAMECDDVEKCPYLITIMEYLFHQKENEK